MLFYGVGRLHCFCTSTQVRYTIIVVAFLTATNVNTRYCNLGCEVFVRQSMKLCTVWLVARAGCRQCKGMVGGTHLPSQPSTSDLYRAQSIRSPLDEQPTGDFLVPRERLRGHEAPIAVAYAENRRLQHGHTAQPYRSLRYQCSNNRTSFAVSSLAESNHARGRPRRPPQHKRRICMGQ
jgi:hypothetical protein